jgi:hypothetical protein
MSVSIESPEDRIIDQVTLSQQHTLERVEAAGSAMLDSWERSREEITDFIAERIRQDLEAQAALMRCRNLGEVGAVQAKFIGTAVAQYGDEVQRLLDIGRRLAERSLGRS